MCGASLDHHPDTLKGEFSASATVAKGLKGVRESLAQLDKPWRVQHKPYMMTWDAYALHYDKKKKTWSSFIEI